MFSLAQKYGHEGILRTGSTHFEPVSWHILSGISGTIHGQYDAPASGIGLSPAFPNSASRKKIKKHEPIMVDFGITYYGYQVDSTRMFSIGAPDEKFLEYYEKSKIILNEIVSNFNKIRTCNELFETGKLKSEELNIAFNYLGIGENKKTFVGHGVGLETSELPLISKRSRDFINENNTVAVEPKIVVENYGIIGIENTYLITENGYKLLTPIREDILIK
jgi:Xaa-Pro dipeptidase